MLYRIQETIFFRSDDGVVWLNDELKASLTATTSRLLAYLLDNKHRVVAKDEILDKVWDAYGLSTSSNSLYKYISDLRAVFRSLGCEDEFITTVPKIGFMISPVIRVEEMGEISAVERAEPAKEKPSKDERIDNDEHRASVTTPRKTHAFSLRKLSLFSLCLVLLVAIIGAGFQLMLPVREKKELFNLGSLDNCLVSSFSLQDKDKSMAILRAMSEQKRMKCTKGSIYFVQFSVPVLSGKKGRVFFSRCRQDEKNSNNFIACENYYKVDYAIAP